MRGRGERRVPAAPQPRVRSVESTRVFTTVAPESPGIPARNGFDGVCRASLRATLLLSAGAPYPTNQARMQIMEEGDVVAHACEPPHFADHCWRVDCHATAGTSHRCLTRGLADPDGALRQRLPGRGSNRYALAHSLPEDERTVRTVVRCREQRRGGRRAGGGCRRGRNPGWENRWAWGALPPPAW